ncbi:MAG TPA: hemerythrin domain-containing protein [Nitrospirales bacterium]|nr:hemerythrin domain-containing protein [Nitrospirales bacterium]
MDIFQILKKDHQAAKDLFKKLETTGSRATKSREKLFSQLKDDLEAHSHGEEAVFYPALRENAEMVDLIDEATEEHANVENLLEELEELGPESEEWHSKLTELKKSVLHHVKEEEGEIFKKAKEILEKEEIQRLGKEFQEAKKQATAG